MVAHNSKPPLSSAVIKHPKQSIMSVSFMLVAPVLFDGNGINNNGCERDTREMAMDMHHASNFVDCNDGNALRFLFSK